MLKKQDLRPTDYVVFESNIDRPRLHRLVFISSRPSQFIHGILSSRKKHTILIQLIMCPDFCWQTITEGKVRNDICFISSFTVLIIPEHSSHECPVKIFLSFSRLQCLSERKYRRKAGETDVFIWHIRSSLSYFAFHPTTADLAIACFKHQKLHWIIVKNLKSSHKPAS